MSKFAPDDLVRLVTKDGTGVIVRVVVCDDEYGDMHIEYEDGTQAGLVSVDEYELVKSAENSTVHKGNKPLTSNEPHRTHADIHDDVSKMFVQVIQYIRGYTDDKITLSIEATVYNEHDDMEVGFCVACNYDDTITTDNLFRSAEIAASRHRQNKELKRLKIPFHKKDEAA